MEVPDSNKIGDFDYLMLQAAIHIYRHTQPFILASYYNSVNKRDSALEIVKEIVRDKNNANKAWAYNLWGNMLHDQKEYDEAINKYNIALNEDPKFVLAHYNLGIAYCDDGKYSKAKESYEKAIDLDPQFSNAYYNLGKVYGDEGDYSKAREYYEKAIHFDSTYSDAHNNLGLTYDNEGDYSKAKEMYEKIIEIDPDGEGKEARKRIENLPE